MAQRLGTRSLPSYLLPRDTLLLRATKNREVLFYYGATPAETSAVYQVRVYSAAVGLGLTSGRIAKSILFNRSISTGTLRTGKSARTLLFRRQRRSYSSTNPNPPSGARNTSASSDRPARVVLIGARGYTGSALIYLLNKHPHIELSHVSSRELVGQKLKDYTKKDITYSSLTTENVRKLAERKEIDCWVMALPNGVCKPFVAAIEEAGDKNAVIVDLSADYRFDSKWTYGLPELVTRSKIAEAKRISNPGCYATAAQVGISPILKYCGGQPTVFGVSGYSGAGTKPSPKNDVKNLTDSLIAYSLTDHIHEREISNQLGIDIAFIPHVAVWFQGIHHTISIPLSQSMTARDIRNIYQDRYAGEPLVKVIGEAPNVKDIAGKHHIEVGGFAVHSSNKRAVVCVTIDNLLKGAATQCLQNMNLALGFDEFSGIPITD